LSSLANAIAANGGTTAGLTAANFALPGAQVQFSFYMPYKGSPATRSADVMLNDRFQQAILRTPPAPLVTNQHGRPQGRYHRRQFGLGDQIPGSSTAGRSAPATN
jgi:hypothetical protein